MPNTYTEVDLGAVSLCCVAIVSQVCHKCVTNETQNSKLKVKLKTQTETQNSKLKTLKLKT